MHGQQNIKIDVSCVANPGGKNVEGDQTEFRRAVSFTARYAVPLHKFGLYGT